jgi:protein TonB
VADDASQASGGRGEEVAALVPGGSDGGVEYGAYLASIRRLIQQSLDYPAAARRRSLTGTVQLEIVIESTGAIARVAVVDSSSHRVLDEAAVQTVQALPPVPFPPGLSRRTLRARLPIVFELRNAP